MNLYLLWKSPCKSTPEGYFQWSGSRTVKSDVTALNFMQFSRDFCH